jgi:hypothetical protein
MIIDERGDPRDRIANRMHDRASSRGATAEQIEAARALGRTDRSYARQAVFAPTTRAARDAMRDWWAHRAPGYRADLLPHHYGNPQG